MNMKLFQRENGYWYIQVSRGKKIALKTKDESIARKAFKKRERAFFEGKLVQIEKEQLTLFNDFKTEYLGNGKDIVGVRKPSVKEKTYKADNLAVEKFYEWFGNKPMIGITRRKLQDYRTYLLTLKLKPNTVNNYIRHLKFALKQAMSWNYIKDRDAFLDFKQVAIPHGQITYMNEAEVKHLIDTAQKSKYKEMTTIIPFLLYTGIPRQNICNQIYISDVSVQYRRGKTQILVDVPIMDKLRPYLSHLKAGVNRLTKFHPDTIGHRFKEIAWF